MKIRIENLLQVIAAHHKFVIGCHVHPDGDAIGSMLAMGLALGNLGKQVAMVCTEGVPTVYSFLEGVDTIMPEPDFHPEVLILVDCAEKDRVAVDEPIWATSGLFVVNLDHHITNTDFGDLNIVDAEAAATGELIYRILQQGKFPLDHRIATALYTAIATDTGFFRYESTSAFTLETAAMLVKHYQVRPYKIAEYVHEQKSINSIRLLGEILSNIHLEQDNRVAWVMLDQGLLARYPVENEETESYVNYARSIEGVEIGVILKELKPNEFKISWRSTEAVDVSKLAAFFGGGGHARAAGCTIEGKADDAVKKVLDSIAEYYKTK